MKIKNVYLKNIRSYKEAKIAFPEGSTLLSGDIGSGKSTVLLAVEFALFGLQKGLLSGQALLKNSSNNGAVKVDLEIGKKHVEIERTLKRQGSAVVQGKANIMIDGVQEKLSAQELKSKILQLLGYPQEFLRKTNLLYRYTVYTPQEEMRQILTEDEESRVDTIRRIFGLDKYKRIAENVKIFSDKLREYEKSYETFSFGLEEKEQELSNIKTKLLETRKKAEEIREKIISAKKILSEKKTLLKDEEKKSKLFSELKMQHEKKKIEIDMVCERRKESEKEVEKLKKEIKELSSEIGKITKEKIENLKREILKEEENLPKIEEIYKNILKNFSATENKLKELISSEKEISQLEICPKCKQLLSKEHKEKLLSKIFQERENEKMKYDFQKKSMQEMEEKLSNIKEKLKKLREEREIFASKEAKIKNLEDKKFWLARTETAILAFEEKEKNLRNEAEEIKKQLAESAYDESKHEELKVIVEQAERVLKEEELKKASLDTEIAGKRETIKMLEEDVCRKRKAKKMMENLRKIRNFLLGDFSLLLEKIEQSVMAKLRSSFSSLFGKWFSMLTIGLDARINENFSPIIEHQGYMLDYSYLSGGERTAAALAYRLALNQTLNFSKKLTTRDILVLDEPTDGFSSEQLDKMNEVLAELKTAQLIIVSHEPKMENFVQHIIRFSKENGITKISQDI